MTIKQNIVKPSQYSVKCPYPMEAVGICVHNTANDASSKNEINYMVGNNLKTSFHFAVDDIEIWQGLPLDRNGWHAGDGQGAGNRKHIAIEICHSKSGGEKFIKAENNAITLIVKLLKERGWGVEKVKKHQDFSGKYCPHRTLDLGWERFIKQIETQMGGVIINPPMKPKVEDTVAFDLTGDQTPDRRLKPTTVYNTDKLYKDQGNGTPYVVLDANSVNFVLDQWRKCGDILRAQGYEFNEQGEIISSPPPNQDSQKIAKIKDIVNK